MVCVKTIKITLDKDFMVRDIVQNFKRFGEDIHDITASSVEN